MSKILVTGGAGFIGSHLCEELAKNPLHQVTSLDNYSLGSEYNHALRVKYIKGNTADIEALVRDIPEIVFHLGEYSRVEQSFDDLNLVYQSNKLGTIAVLEYCRKHTCKLIYAGSSTKFCDAGLGRNQSPYAWTKATNSELVSNYGRWFGLSHAITYFYNAYGPREIGEGKYATLIALFAKKMRQKKALPVSRPGTQMRNFTHVKDIVSGLILVSEQGQGDEYGIGASRTYSVLEVAKLFGGKIEMRPERLGNRMSSDLMIQKTSQLGWVPKYDLAQYIEELKRKNWAV